MAPGRRVDFWGFYVDATPWYERTASRKFVIEHEALDQRRDPKWAQMTRSNSDEDGSLSLESYCRSHKRKLKSRVRKGVPRLWRRHVWPALLEVSVNDDARESASSYRESAARRGATYSALISKSAGDATKDSIFEVIERDLCRTYPKNIYFDSKKVEGGLSDRDREAVGVKALRRILRAYATFDDETEYCQGMNYVAALFLIHTCFVNAKKNGKKTRTSAEDDEEDAFWLFVAALRAPRTNLRELYGPGMVGARRALSVYDAILQTTHPRLRAHFESENCIPDMYATHWIVTLFAAQFPFAFVSRVWDMFLAEGWKPVYRVAVALVGSYEQHLLGLDFEHLMTFMRDLPQQLDVEKVFDHARKLSFPKTAYIHNLETTFQTPRSEDDSFS